MYFVLFLFCVIFIYYFFFYSKLYRFICIITTINSIKFIFKHIPTIFFYIKIKIFFFITFFSSDVQTTRIQDEDVRERASSFGRSIATTRQRPNVLALSSSRSENTLSKQLASGGTSAATQRVLNTSNSPAVEEESSPESTGTEISRTLKEMNQWKSST